MRTLARPGGRRHYHSQARVLVQEADIGLAALTDENIAKFEHSRVIMQDVERTRADTPFFKKASTQAWLKRVLTYYCLNGNVEYMQVTPPRLDYYSSRGHFTSICRTSAKMQYI